MLHDVSAGLVLGLVSVPDGLAAGLLAGVTPNGRYPDVSGDFPGQGIANIAAGLLRGVCRSPDRCPRPR